PDGDYDNSDDYISDLNLTAPAATEDDFDPFTQVAAQTSLPERLINELQAMLSDPDMAIATYLVGNLNDNGYLQMTVEEVAHQIDVPVEAVERVLAILQSLEPIGIGARDLRECLLIQLRYLEGEGIVCPVATKIVESHLQELAEHKFSKIAAELGVTTDAIAEASHFIRHRLNPYPAQGYGAPDPNTAENRATIILPDVIINHNERATFDLHVIHS